MKLIILLIIISFILVGFYTKYSLSLSEDFTKLRTCTDVFGPPGCGSTTLDDVIITPNILTCNGTQVGPSTRPHVNEIYINQTVFLINSGINVKCEFKNLGGAGNNSAYIWYHNGSGWYNVYNNTDFIPGDSNYYNVSISFKLNASTRTQLVRCINAYKNTDTGSANVPNNCANSTYVDSFDNDDVNFTVTDYPKYTFWNLTNYTTGETIRDGSHLTRNDTINASAQWDKQRSLKHFNELHHFLLRVGRTAIDSYTWDLSLFLSSCLQQPFSPSVFL